MGIYLSARNHSVKCVDETGGWLAEKLGNDEIWLCGYADDIFPQVLSTVSFSNGAVDNRYPTSFQVRAHEGTYEVNYDWCLGEIFCSGS